MGFTQMTTHKELLAFRDDTGVIRLVDAAPSPAVELVKEQAVLRAMLTAVAISATGPIFAVVEGDKRV
jgi:hypothetical protein